MSNTIKHKRSAVPNAVPATGQMALGELAVNTNDGRVFTKRDVGGNETVVEVGFDKLPSSRITISPDAPSGGTDGDLWFRYSA